MNAVLRVALAVLVVSRVQSFLRSHSMVNLPESDYTLEVLTEEGIIRAVARYFEDSNPERYHAGDLTGQLPLTTFRLFELHYGNCTDASKLEQAVLAIVKENTRISRLNSNRAMWHFNGNLINAGNRKMKGIREALLQELTEGDENAPDYDSARRYCGQFLHMAQSFYANTNWIEFNRNMHSEPDAIRTLPGLGISDELPVPQSPDNVDMCLNCPRSNIEPEYLNCSNNLRPYVNYLTGGYRDNQDIRKPAAESGSTAGKCSHGGFYDTSRLRVGKGGINKESSSRLLSPHNTLHRQAALTALQATEDFFYHPEIGLYNLIGEKKFRKLLNLDIGTSLTFVIDTTGSMSDEIQAVKDETINIVNRYRNTCFAASKYVVVPFSDPDVGPAFVTTDPQECIDFLSSLRANAGGDCPEMANTGMVLGLQHSLQRGTVYFFTDADDKDPEELPNVLALCEEKSIEVTIMLTGRCGGSRRKRDTEYEGMSSFEIIALASGGDIYETDNSGIRELTRVIEADLRASQVTLTKKSLRRVESFSVRISVDSTMDEMLVSLTGNIGGDVVLLEDPSGASGSPYALGASVFTSSNQQMVFSISTTQKHAKGDWVLLLQNLDSSALYRIKVSSNSPIDFNYQLMEADSSGTIFPMDGLPVAGAKVHILIRVTAPEKVTNVTEALLHDRTGQLTLLVTTAEAVPSRLEGMFVAKVTLPEQPFFISVTGFDVRGMRFLRTQPSEIQVMDFKLEHVLGNNTIEELIPGGVGNFTFRVTNNGPDDKLLISVALVIGAGDSTSSASVFTASVAPTTLTLASNESALGVVTLVAAANAPSGSSGKVTLTVRSATTDVINFLSVSSTVFEPKYVVFELINKPVESVDKASPTCTVLNVVGSCSVNEMDWDCHLHRWSLYFRATDNTMIAEIAVSPDLGESQSLMYDEYSLVNTTAIYTAPCCCPTLNITVFDGAGNSAWCGHDFYQPVASQIAEPMCNGPIIDRTPPVCKILDTSSVCTDDQMGKDCHLHEWWVRYIVTDDTAVSSVALYDSPDNSKWLIEQEESSPMSRTSVFRTTCCCPWLGLNVSDIAGNYVLCGLDQNTFFSGVGKRPACKKVLNLQTRADPDGLPTGPIVGIVLGSILVLVLMILFVFALIKNFLAKRGKTKFGSSAKNDKPPAQSIEILDYKPVSTTEPAEV